MRWGCDDDEADLPSPQEAKKGMSVQHTTVEETIVTVDLELPPRWRFVLCGVFAAAYVCAVGAMSVAFDNYVAASGFACTVVMILLYLLLLKHRPERIMHCTFLSLSCCGLVVFSALMFGYLAAAGYFLYAVVANHEPLNGRSHVCAAVAFAMAAKWSAFAVYRIKYFRALASRIIKREGLLACGHPAKAITVVICTPEEPKDHQAKPLLNN
jgi:hypothetical protein